MGDQKTIFVASALSGITSRIILHPIDTIKSRMQIQVNGFDTSSNLSKNYKNTFDAIKTITKFEGFQGFYKGLGPSVLLTGFANSLFLGGYEKFKHIFSKHVSNQNTIQFLSGFFAEAVSCVLWVPHDVLKERLQVQREKNQSKIIFDNIRKNGIRSLYKGYWVTLGTFGPNSALYLLSYEFFKEKILHQELTFYNTLISASVSNAIAAVITNPLDVIKVRYQVFPDQYKSFYDAFSQMYKSEGSKAFWKGVGPRVLYSAPNAGIIMMLFEYFKKMNFFKEFPI